MLTSVVDENFAVSGGQVEYQKNFEKDIETKVIGILEPVVGKGKVKARAAASLDFTKVEKTEERYDPDSQVARSEQRNAEKSTNGTSGGVPGVASNLPGKQQTTPAQAGSSALSEKKNETINYEISKTISRIISAAGGIKKLSVVVLVDGNYAAGQNSTEKKYTARSEDELRQFEDMVKKAIGFSTERGDEVKVVNMPFEVIPQEEITENGTAPSKVMPMVMTASKFLIPLVGVVLLFLFVIKPLMKTLTAPTPMPQSIGLPQTMAEAQRTISAPERTSQAQLADWAKSNPKDAANLIKGWLEEK
jgi:flagellar M-ring protein FliF